MDIYSFSLVFVYLGEFFVVCFVLAAQHSFAILEVGLVFWGCIFPFIPLLHSQSVPCGSNRGNSTLRPEEGTCDLELSQSTHSIPVATVIG